MSERDGGHVRLREQEHGGGVIRPSERGGGQIRPREQEHIGGLIRPSGRGGGQIRPQEQEHIGGVIRPSGQGGDRQCGGQIRRREREHGGGVIRPSEQGDSQIRRRKREHGGGVNRPSERGGGQIQRREREQWCDQTSRVGYDRKQDMVRAKPYVIERYGITNHIYEPHPEQLSDFQIFRLGDIDLRKEVRLNRQSAVVAHRLGSPSRCAGVRRMYTAKIRCNPGPVTVAIYEGEGTENEWRLHLAKYESIRSLRSARHPNIMQLYGLVRTKRLRAMVFHDDCRIFCKGELKSNVLVDLSNLLTTPLLGREELSLPSFPEATNVWIRPATGTLCLDLVHDQGHEINFEYPWSNRTDIVHLEHVSLDDPDAEVSVISSLDEHDGFRTENVVKNYGGSWNSRLGRARIPLQNYGFGDAELLPNSWMRYDSRRVAEHLSSELYILYRSDFTFAREWSPFAFEFWPTQTAHNNPRGICSFVRPRTSERERIFNGRTVPHIGPSIHPVLPSVGPKG
ncbi:hypothetical protein C8R45DRAFT_939862 [Mycena sanguinolenta]|nr:hypothetical protein C8R45DRAFT_939862 [Mycena sanguinolenta]